MVAEKVNMDDECLVNYVKGRRLCYPSALQYNLTTRTDRTIEHVRPINSLQSFLLDKDAPWIEALIAVETFVPKVCNDFISKASLANLNMSGYLDTCLKKQLETGKDKERGEGFGTMSLFNTFKLFGLVF